MTNPADYLAVEGLIEARLRERLPAGVRVLTAPDLAAAQESGWPVPAVIVQYGGDRDINARTPAFLDITQEWVLVVAVSNARANRDGSAARGAAGALLIEVLGALAGWAPGPGYAPLTPVNGGFRNAYQGDKAYFPVSFTTSFRLRF